MAFKKTLVQRLFNLSRFSTPSISRNPTGKPPLPDASRTGMVPDRGEGSKMRRIQQRRPIYQSAMPTGVRLFPQAGEKLVEKLRGMDIARDRVRFDGLIPFPAPAEKKKKGVAREGYAGMSVSEVRKVLRASQVEMIRGKLKEIERDWISYSEFVGICRESCGGNSEQAFSFAKTLDESGSVIILGNAVCLRPHQVAKAIQSVVSPSTCTVDDSRREELEEMEELKAEIDRKADGLVRRELWAGLGYLAVQTAAFMRLTFWELSWDVMEPICFYVTSFYFMAGYAFFLRTSKEPSFEGFFQSRFSAKQRKLMKAHNFDLHRYNELRKAFYSSSSSSLSSSSSSSSLDDTKLIKFGDLHKNY